MLSEPRKGASLTHRAARMGCAVGIAMSCFLGFFPGTPSALAQELEPETEFAQLSESWSQDASLTESATLPQEPKPPAAPLVPDEVFESYDSAKGALLGLLKMAKDRVGVISPALLDGEIATSLHSLKLARKSIFVVIGNPGRNLYNSRHSYLITAKVPVYFTNLKSITPKDSSLIVIDNVTLSFGAPFDPNWRKSVAVRPANWKPSELFAAINSKGPLLRGATPKPETAAKPSTNTKESISPNSGTLEGRVRLRARPIESKTSEIPRSLPKSTRMKEIQAGMGSPEDPVKPVRLLREDALRLDSEAELRAD